MNEKLLIVDDEKGVVDMLKNICFILLTLRLMTRKTFRASFMILRRTWM